MTPVYTCSLQEAADHVGRDKSLVWRRVKAMNLGVVVLTPTGRVQAIRLSEADIEELEEDIQRRARKPKEGGE
jgi:predicted transcriptional regulator